MRVSTKFILLTAALAASASTSASARPATPATPRAPTTARLGQSVIVDGPHVRPIAIIEDSRCPRGVQCIWAGQVRLKIRVGQGRSTRVKEVTLGSSVPVADGRLSLVSVVPERVAGRALRPRDYRFGFTFAGGL
jgi:hypothetical protein